MTQLSENALNIFKMLYSKNGETPEDTFRRAAKAVSKSKEEEDLVVQLQVDNIIRFNTPLYFNSGGKTNLFSACWVVPLEDSMNGIYEVANVARKIFSYGSGIGIPIGNLREKDAPIFDGDDESICYARKDFSGTIEQHEYVNGKCSWCGKSDARIVPTGQSSGPITFMKLYDAVAATTKSGGRARRAAILCAMPVWHPDILDFIQAKEIDGTLSNMNLSVTITDKFMQCLEDNIPFPLHTPYDGSFIKNEDPKLIWDSICKQAHKTGDPGVIFIDTVNKFNPLKKKILIETTNVCGEQPLRAYESCALAMINVAKFVKEDMTYDWDGLFEAAKNLTIFMNNMVNVMDFPDEKFREQSIKYKPIGIGPAGLSDAMFLLGLRYNGKDGKDFAAEVMRTITHGSIRKSIELAKELGPFHQYSEVKDDTEAILASLIKVDDYDEEALITLEMLDEYGVHNVQHSTCAPTGCLVGSTIVPNNKGLFNIKEYKNFNLPNGIIGKSDFHKITFKQFYDQGVQQTKKIKTRFGYSLTGTFNHKIRVLGENNSYIWKKLEDVTVDDYAIMKSGFLLDILSEADNVDTNLAEFIGFYMADGWTKFSGKDKRFGFSIHKRDLSYLEDLLDRVPIYNGTHVVERNDDLGEGVRVRVNGSRELWEWMKTNNCIKLNSLNAFIPDIILKNSSLNVIKAFLRGIFKGDGINAKRCFGYRTISKTLIEQLHILLLGLNFKTFLREEHGPPTREICGRTVNCQETGYLIIFIDQDSPRFSEFLDLPLRPDWKDSKSYELIPIMPDEKRWFSDSIKDNGKEFVKTYLYSRQAKSQNMFVKNFLFADKIKEIEYTGAQQVYDLEVKESGHTYVANGFVTHNTTALACDCSYGIEPCFGLVYEKNLMTGKTMKMINPIFEEKYKNESWFTSDLIEKIFVNGGSLKNIRGIPKEVKEVFVIAHDIKPKDRVEMQACIQKHCSTAISSTVNLPSTATSEEISEIYKLAYELGLKGVTVYRNGCKKNQPVTFKKEGLEVISNFERPSKLNAIKHCIQLADGKLYVDVVKHENRIVEIWLDYGKSGQEINGLLEALGKSLSTGVQHGVPKEAYIKQFINIKGDFPVWFKFEDSDKKPVQLHSIPDALAKLLERYYKDDEIVYNESSSFETETCPKCQNNSIMNIEGCKTCSSCGWSKCS